MTAGVAEQVPSLSVLGSPVSVFDSHDDAVNTIRRRIAARQSTFCVAMNPEKVYRANHDPRLKQVLEQTHVRICDGIGVSLAARLLYGKRLARCTGIDLFLSLAQCAASEGWRVFLLGASPALNAAAAKALQARYPGLILAGTQHGFFKNTGEVVEQINRSGADLLFVAMGSPRQEFWISENMPRLNAPFCMGVGGSFDVVSGAAKRAPAIFRKSGTEWLYRLLANPSRLQRQVALPLFAWGVVRAVIFGTKQSAHTL